MPIQDYNGTASTAIAKLYDNDGTASRQIGKVYDNDGTTSRLIYTAAEAFAVAAVSTTAHSTYTYHAADAYANTASFALDSHTSITFAVHAVASGNYRADYLPSTTAKVLLKNTSGATIKEWSKGQLVAGGQGNYWGNGTFDVSGLSGTYYLQVYAWTQSQNINNADGSSQTVNYFVSAESINVNI